MLSTAYWLLLRGNILVVTPFESHKHVAIARVLRVRSTHAIVPPRRFQAEKRMRVASDCKLVHALLCASPQEGSAHR
jgi:hypothetical protein